MTTNQERLEKLWVQNALLKDRIADGKASDEDKVEYFTGYEELRIRDTENRAPLPSDAVIGLAVGVIQSLLRKGACPFPGLHAERNPLRPGIVVSWRGTDADGTVSWCSLDLTEHGRHAFLQRWSDGREQKNEYTSAEVTELNDRTNQVRTQGHRPQAEAELIAAAVRWWQSYRPEDWGMERHLEQPFANIPPDSPLRELAGYVAEYLRAPKPKARVRVTFAGIGGDDPDELPSGIRSGRDL
jgi:hypothetical protein